MGKLSKKKYYLQPLGLLRGCSRTDDNFKRLAGSEIYFSTLRIISRDDNKNIAATTIPVNKLNEYLAKLPADHVQEIITLLKNIEKTRPPMKINEKWEFNWIKPVIQGVLNMTPDSFSDGGEYNDLENSILRAQQMINDGASIIDIGGESTRPGAEKISIAQEISRVLPVIVALKENNIPLSIDSRNGDVMKAACVAGAHIINDVSALMHDIQSAHIVKQSNLPVILMHAKGDPETMQINPVYDSAVLDIFDYLQERIEFCEKQNISSDKIIVDPGIGFGKSLKHNLQILNGFSLFHGLGVPLLVGVSRKSFIGKISHEITPAKRVYGSIAAAQICLEQGAQIIRVHDVAPTKQALSVWNATIDQINIF